MGKVGEWGRGRGTRLCESYLEYIYFLKLTSLYYSFVQCVLVEDL